MTKVKRTSDIVDRGVPKKRRGVGRIMLRILLWSMLICAVLGGLGAFGFYTYMSRDLPKIETLKDYHPPIITTVFSDDGSKIAEFYNERRIVIPLSDMPDTLLSSFIAAEDSRFYKHRGVDILSIIRAFMKNVEAGTIVQGGSTITQQVTKSFFLSPERSYTRKMKEAILAYRIEKALKKEEILYGLS